MSSPYIPVRKTVIQALRPSNGSYLRMYVLLLHNSRGAQAKTYMHIFFEYFTHTHMCACPYAHTPLPHLTHFFQKHKLKDKYMCSNGALMRGRFQTKCLTFPSTTKSQVSDTSIYLSTCRGAGNKRKERKTTSPFSSCPLSLCQNRHILQCGHPF